MTEDQVQAGFERRAVFERIRAANRMRHRKAYQALERELGSGSGQSPRILDIGCGDAREVAGILNRIPPADYTGVDNDADAIEQARFNLAGVSRPWRLTHGDYTQVFGLPPAGLDVIWMGLFLHHLPAEQKRRFFQRAVSLLSSGGAVLAHDPVLSESEDRRGFIDRIALASRGWGEISDEEREMLGRHWSLHGHQERVSRLEELAGQSGFSRIEVLWRDPDDFYAVMAFRR